MAIVARPLAEWQLGREPCPCPHHPRQARSLRCLHHPDLHLRRHHHPLVEGGTPPPPGSAPPPPGGGWPPPPGSAPPPPPGGGWPPPPPAGPGDGPADQPAPKKKWPWIVGAIVALFVVAAIAGGGEKDDDKDEVATSATTEAPSASTTEPEAEAPDTTEREKEAATTTAAPTTAAPTTAAPPTAPPPTAPPESVSQSNARRSAADYLDYSAFSRTGLIDQLKYEGFSQEDATYGVDSLNADWKAQAAESAADYLEYSSFSRSTSSSNWCTRGSLRRKPSTASARPVCSWRLGTRSGPVRTDPSRGPLCFPSVRPDPRCSPTRPDLPFLSAAVRRSTARSTFQSDDLGSIPLTRSTSLSCPSDLPDREGSSPGQRRARS